ncbi:MAG: CBS domain-containing protein [Anaerolineales bacterium]|nr:CBS domain-containing protein [Anaerolineales bacterium]
MLSALIPVNIQEARHYKDQVRHAVAVTAGEFTEPDFHTVTPDTTLEEVMELMLDPNVTVLPVVEGEQVVGIVTRNDIVRLIEQLEGALNPEEVEEDVEAQILGGLTEILLYVADMGAMVTFYGEKLGLRVEEPLEAADYSNIDWVVFDTGACKLCLHSGGKRRLGEDTPMIVFGVIDIEDARKILAERGVELDEVKEVAPGMRVCHGHDPEGNPFSIEERK